MIRWLNIFAVALTVAAAASLASADEPAGVARKPAPGSVAAQMRLKLQLKAQAEGTTLAAALNHNRHEWETLTPDQREEYRSVARAYLDKSPSEQEKLLKHYDQLMQMSPAQRAAYRERANWLKEVVAGMTEQERAELLQLRPAERARVLTEKRAELIRAGKLPAETTTLPATAPIAAP